MKDKIDDYMFYKRCVVCGKIIDENIYDDNSGLCDDCYTDVKSWDECNYSEGFFND